MCEICANSIKEFFPEVPDKEYGNFAMSVTCFPFGHGEEVRNQLKELRAITDDWRRCFFWSIAIWLDIPMAVFHRKEEIDEIIKSRYN